VDLQIRHREREALSGLGADITKCPLPNRSGHGQAIGTNLSGLSIFDEMFARSASAALRDKKPRASCPGF
jgi:hypothetical protein